MFSTRLGLDAFSLHTHSARLNKVARDEISVRASHTIAVYISFAPKSAFLKCKR